MKLAWVVSLWALTGLALVNSSPIKLEIEIKKAGPYPERQSDSFGKSASTARSADMIRRRNGTYDPNNSLKMD